MIDKDWVPSDEDIIRARSMTIGVNEITFSSCNVTWRVVDVGGQRSERKKWVHCFEHASCVIFFIALDDYDKTLYEVKQVNRMQETLYLLREVSNCKWFENVDLVILLNKK